MSFWSLMKRPSAFLPVAMSLAAIVLLLGHVVLFGTQPQPDEGTDAHLFQLLIAAQLPVVIYFLATWIPRTRVKALRAFALQVGAVLAAFTLVYLMHW